jgi:uncharacterized membrane protein
MDSFVAALAMMAAVAGLYAVCAFAERRDTTKAATPVGVGRILFGCLFTADLVRIVAMAPEAIWISFLACSILLPFWLLVREW